MSSPFISAIILSHNKLEYTQKCIHSLLETAYPSWEMVIIDNGSTDGTVEWLQNFKAEAEQLHVHVKLILNHDNIGCSTARNLGIEAATGDLIAFCDNDIALKSRNWLTELSNQLLANPNCGMTGPKLIYPFPPFNIQCAGTAVSPNGRVQFRGRGQAGNTPAFNEACDVQALISACCLARKSILDEIGGFDELFNPVEYEDIDLCYKIRQAGYTIRYSPQVEMYHFENVTTEGTPALANTYLLVKHGMLFKQRWQHMFANENGPADAECRWQTIATRKLSDIGVLEMV